MTTDDVMDAVHQFQNAIRTAGLTPPVEIEADGRLRRFASNGKRADDSGWYVLHGDGVPAGSFGDWRTGLNQIWRAEIGRKLTPGEESAHRSRVEAMRQQREDEDKARRQAAAAEAVRIWRESSTPTHHNYLARKGIGPCGAKLYQECLVLPLHDTTGAIHSLQFISPEGEKRFLPGGRVQGGYFSMGKPEGVLCIAEGFATGASIHLATGHAVAVTFNAGNLEAVAKALRAKYHDLKLILCADDDTKTEGNPGLTKATEAAQAVGGLLAVPDFGDTRPDGATDFNDLAQAQGLEAVKNAIEAATATAGVEEARPITTDALKGNPNPNLLTVCSLHELLAASLPEPAPIVAPILFEADLAMIYGWRGCGKTWFALALAYAIASGGAFLNWACGKARRVLYLDGEMRAARLRKRLAMIAKASLPIQAEDGFLNILTRDMQPMNCDWPDLGRPDGRAEIASIITRSGAEVIVLDNISAWVRSGKGENDEEHWRDVASFLMTQRAHGRAVVLIHHSGKSGAQRGTSKREDILDTVIALKKPDDYDPAEGLRVQVEFEKARNLDGGDIPSIEIKLVTKDHKAIFEVIECKTDPITVVHELIGAGASRTEIMTAVGMNRFQILRLEKKAESLGRPFKLPDARKGNKKGEPNNVIPIR